MKILHITKKYPGAIGGDANVVRSLETHQEKQGHDIFILSASTRELWQKKNVIRFGIRDTAVNLDRVTPRRIISLGCFILTLIRIVSAKRPDIIHTHSAELGFLASFWAKFLGIPVIQTCHGVCFNDRSYSPLKRAFEAFFLKYGAFSCITTVDRCSLADFSRLGISRVRYIPNGVNAALFYRERRDTAPHPFSILFVGRLEHQKGLDILIEAAMNLKKIMNDFSLNIVGDGSLKDTLVQQISSRSLGDCVHILGNLPTTELIRQYASSDAFVLPSRWEGMPLTLLEAWAAGLPAIVTNVGGLTEVCRNEENALVVRAGDPYDLCQAMRLLAKHHELAERLGTEGNRIARTEYSWDSVSNAYMEVYLQMVRHTKYKKP